MSADTSEYPLPPSQILLQPVEKIFLFWGRNWSTILPVDFQPLSQVFETTNDCYIQPFRQRLFPKSVKAYATRPIGIMNSNSLDLLDWGSRRFSNKERERTNTSVFVLFPSTTLKHLEVHSSNRRTTITHNNFRHCRVSFSPFVRQPFSKQLYRAHTLTCPAAMQIYWIKRKCLHEKRTLTG